VSYVIIEAWEGRTELWHISLNSWQVFGFLDQLYIRYTRYYSFYLRAQGDRNTSENSNRSSPELVNPGPTTYTIYSHETTISIPLKICQLNGIIWGINRIIQKLGPDKNQSKIVEENSNGGPWESQNWRVTKLWGENAFCRSEK